MWEKLLSQQRFSDGNKIEENADVPRYRNNFHKDYDRLIFSNSFRRLSKKTQVHPLSNNDHVHNRLTHSLEVASVGRSLGLRAGELICEKYTMSINPHDVAYIVQTACLAHDIGNPPFGHAGEEVIKEWFKKNEKECFLSDLDKNKIADFQNLDGNAQSLRILSQLERNPFSGGMRLTFATLGTLIKYPYSSSECEQRAKSKFNFFKSEEAIFKRLFGELGLEDKGGGYRRHPLSYLMEVSDDICYGLLDLQDAIELRIITLADTKEIFYCLCGELYTNVVLKNAYSDVRKVAKLVGESINNLTLHAMHVFEENIDNIVEGEQPNDLISLFTEVKLKKGIEGAKALGLNKIFNDKRKAELELGSYNIIETILDNFIRATYKLYTENEDDLSFRDKRVLILMGNDRPIKVRDLYEMYQKVIDYLVGMTDNHAKYIARQINGMG